MKKEKKEKVEFQLLITFWIRLVQSTTVFNEFPVMNRNSWRKVVLRYKYTMIRIFQIDKRESIRV